MAASTTVAVGKVIGESPAAGTQVAVGSAVNLTVSSGATVPNVVGATETAAITAITGAGLTLGTVTFTQSSSVVSGSVISEAPAAGTSVAPGSAVNLTVSSNFAYVSNGSDGTLSAYSRDASTGALTVLAGSPIAVTGAVGLSEIKFDQSGKFLYVVSNAGSQGIYGFAVNPTDGTLTALNGGAAFATGSGPLSLTFDASGAYLYVANVTGNSVSGYAVNAATGALTPLSGSPYTISGATPSPQQLARAGNFLYVADKNVNSVDVFAINPLTGVLTEGVAGSPFATDTGPFSIAVDPAGTVLYTANSTGSISGFAITSGTGVLTPFTARDTASTARNDIGIDPQGGYLFVTEHNVGGVIAVYKIDGTAPGGLDPPGTSVSSGGNSPNSIAFDASGKFAYVGNDASGTVAQFAYDGAGTLTPLAAPTVAAGTGPDFIAIN
jgi:6-phosphogluconolactonase (cycloisomerase 2 family)